MKFGVMSHNTDGGIAPDDLAREAEARGLESLWLPEHTHIPAGRKTPYPGGPGELHEKYRRIADPFTSVAAAAAVTKTLKLGTGICLVAQHHPITLAKTIATLDRISNGRFLFGIGAGWNEDEMENHGVPPKKRWTMAREHVEAMKVLWTEEEATYHGEFVHFDRVWSFPKPIQKPHPPIIVGTFGTPKGRQRVADLGDGWLPIGLFHGRGFEEAVADLRARLVANGRGPEAVKVSTFDIDEETRWDAFERYATLPGVERAIASCPIGGRDRVLPWLDRFAETARRFAGYGESA